MQLYQIQSDVAYEKTFFGHTPLIKALNVGDSFLAVVQDRPSFFAAAKRHRVTIRTKKVDGDVIRVWRTA